MPQRCYLWAIWLTWIGLPLLAVVVGIRAGVVPAVAVLAIGIVGQVLYVRWFPRLSKALGYGSVADTAAKAGEVPDRMPRVTFYTANVCPFCPILRQRLRALQQQSGFEVDEVDVTFRPEIVRAKKLRSVPALEVNGQLLVGNSTSAQIAEFLRTNAGQQPG